MKTMMTLVAVMAVGGASLCGCASTQIATSQAYVATEGGFDAVVVSVDTAIKTGALSGEAKIRAVALVDTGYAYLKAARIARKVGATTDVAANTVALTALMAQIETLTGARK